MNGTKGKKKLVIVGPLPPPYHGITISTERLVRSRIKDAFELVHFDTSDHRGLDNIGKVDLWNVYFALKQVWLFLLLCVRERPDIVYTTINQNIAYARDALFILLGKWAGGAKVVVHLRGAYFRKFYEKSGFPVKLFVDFTIRRADRVIVLGQCLRYIFERWFDEQEMDVVPNGTPFNPDLSRRPGLREANRGRLVVAYLGNLIEEKGVVDVVRSASRVLAEFPEAEFRFAGAWWDQDEAKAKCEAEIREKGLGDRVRFVGTVSGDAKDRFYLEADIFVFPTYYTLEGHPNVIVEAMAAGLPVISTDYVAIPETVLDGENGFIVPVRDPAAVADRILVLAKDPSLRGRMGTASRRLYEAQYTQEINVEKMIAAFGRCL